ncbi:MAG: hypothetical protein PHV34_20380 [Verrucomicrobiae bacterium]|nr:hypothetical protein [Verrucomicrobiae bacterium]
MDFLIDALEAIWDGLKTFFDKYAAFLAAVLSGIVAFVNAMTAALDEALTALADVVAPSINMPGLPDVVGMVNYVFPLSELFAMLLVLASLWIAAIAYRFVKSWLPTLS